MEEAPGILAACDAAGIALVRSSRRPPQRNVLRAIGERARGFMYTVSVTGPRASGRS